LFGEVTKTNRFVILMLILVMYLGIIVSLIYAMIFLPSDFR